MLCQAFTTVQGFAAGCGKYTVGQVPSAGRGVSTTISFRVRYKAKGGLRVQGIGCPRLHEGNGDGVAEQHLDCGAGDRRQVEGAQLALSSTAARQEQGCLHFSRAATGLQKPERDPARVEFLHS